MAASPDLEIVDMTCLQKLRVFALLDALLDELQRLLHVLRVNGILNLVIAAKKHRVIARAHLEGNTRLGSSSFRSPVLNEAPYHCTRRGAAYTEMV